VITAKNYTSRDRGQSSLKLHCFNDTRDWHSAPLVMFPVQTYSSADYESRKYVLSRAIVSVGQSSWQCALNVRWNSQYTNNRIYDRHDNEYWIILQCRTRAYTTIVNGTIDDIVFVECCRLSRGLLLRSKCVWFFFLFFFFFTCFKHVPFYIFIPVHYDYIDIWFLNGRLYDFSYKFLMNIFL